MPARFYTIATRLMHFGRYGAGGEDPRLTPLYLGYPSLVRGYDVGSFDETDCPPTLDGSCPAADRLTGSRMAVATAGPPDSSMRRYPSPTSSDVGASSSPGTSSGDHTWSNIDRWKCTTSSRSAAPASASWH